MEWLLFYRIKGQLLLKPVRTGGECWFLFWGFPGGNIPRAPPFPVSAFKRRGGFPDRSWSSFYMQLSRYALCGLLDPAARGPVPGLVALTFGLGYRGGGAPYNRGGKKEGKLHRSVQLPPTFFKKISSRPPAGPRRCRSSGCRPSGRRISGRSRRWPCSPWRRGPRTGPSRRCGSADPPGRAPAGRR